MKRFLFLSLSLLLSFSYLGAQELPDLAEKDFKAYLFVYFTGNSGDEEAVRYGISNDGYRYYALNGNHPVIDSKKISSTGGVRDPHILRCRDGQGFYMVATDMTAAKGWDSNRAFVMLKSDDLVHWTSTVINIQKKYSGQENLKRVWAPQTIYDPSAGRYMIYWSMKYGDGPDRIYYAYANKDFTDIEGEPEILFIPKDKKFCIDADIIEKDGIYRLFYKTEGQGNGIREAMTDDLTSGKWIEEPDYKQQTKDAVEGSCTFKLIGSDTYILMYDVYGKGRYQFTESLDLDKFKAIDSKVSLDFHPRHGTVIPITRGELDELLSVYGKPENYTELPSENNPVLSGYFADPEILYAYKDHKYYIYPTSDGFDNWGGYYFKAFSSDNLKNWKDEGVILDLKKDVKWAKRNAWAPCIIEKKRGKGKYVYYFYYVAAQKIGVAVSDQSNGPFRDSGRPLIDFKPEGVKNGQEIDPDVFEDPKTKKNYLYWGNGYMAVAELGKEMTSVRRSTVKVITPPNFTEGTYVFYRKGRYYFMWSKGDTRSPEYCVYYGFSKSPTGPIEIPKNNLVLKGDPSKGIYGTGHNSVIQVPGTDEWKIIYHRFCRPDGIHMGDAAGYHREVCIDKMEFNADGTIRPIVPTL